MIYLGASEKEKTDIVRQYRERHDISKIVVFSPEKFTWERIGHEEVVEYQQIILYKFFYRLLQEIDSRTLIIVNECLRTQNRNDLTYNCLRHYLQQAGHQLIFQYLPIIASFEDIYILVDFDTKSQWKKNASFEMFQRTQIVIQDRCPNFSVMTIPASQKLQHAYAKERERLFTEIETTSKDPHSIPRNLLLVSGKEKACYCKMNVWYLARNARLSAERMQTYKDVFYPHRPYTVFEFCHNYIDFSDVMALSGQKDFDVLTTDLPVEQWYVQRYIQWGEEIEHVYSAIRQQQDRA